MFDSKTIHGEQMLLEIKKRKVYKVNENNIAFNRDDYKRLLLADNITTLAKKIFSLIKPRENTHGRRFYNYLKVVENSFKVCMFFR